MNADLKALSISLKVIKCGYCKSNELFLLIVES